MESYKSQFIALARQCNALSFGEFTLKSGRTSPYFFNAGKFHSGKAIAALGRYYAEALMASNIKFDMIFGPAYKGIPLATSLAIALAEQYGKDYPVAYNRKEAKDHGEGGTLVGAPLKGRVLIIDDVITAGTAVTEVLSILKKARAEPAAVTIGLDRQEKGQSEVSAIAELEQKTGIPVISIIKLEDIIQYLDDEDDSEHLHKIEAYRRSYGTA